jgi:glycosyltransferase involved in cell wall biosynthesis
MVRIVYAGDGKSVFDLFFLSHLVRKYDVYVLTFSEKPYQVPENVHVIRVREPFSPSISPLKGLYTYLASLLRSVLLRRLLSGIKPDVLISSGALSYGFYCALSNYSPNVVFVWGSDVLIAPRLLPFRFIAKYTLRKADALVADSETEENACVSLGCDRRKIVKFPWIDLSHVLSRFGTDSDRERKMRERLREDMGWHKDDRVIISTRHHEPVYDVESLILAIPSVIKKVRNARFLILSNGSLTEELRNHVKELGVESHVRFLGRVTHDEVLRYLRMSDLYVSTSLSDGTSASLLEAMASGLPSVVTNIPANREWIENGKSGILVQTRNSKSLAESIIALLESERLRQSFGRKAYDTVEEKADWQKNSEILDNLICSQLRRRKSI